MEKNPPNPFQKLVRGVLRDFVNQINSQKADKSSKRKTKKSTTSKLQTTPEQEGKKRSRHIPGSVRVSVLHRDAYKCVFCGRSSKEVPLEVDHIIPFVQGGSHDLSNL